MPLHIPLQKPATGTNASKPFARSIKLSSGRIAVPSPSGDFVFLEPHEFERLTAASPDIAGLAPSRIAELYSKHFLFDFANRGMEQLFEARRAARNATVDAGVLLHIIVPTLQCAHSCRYCQVSRALGTSGVSLGEGQIDAVCDTIFESKSQAPKVEFQGGDPLIRFDLVRRAIERICALNASEGRDIQLVVASTLHQLDEDMCAFFRDHNVVLSTSIDGPSRLHNRNRPTSGRNSFERTLAGIELARSRLGPDSVSAIMTTTRSSLREPEAVVDEYVELGFDEVFIRPMALYGFARRNEKLLSYENSEFFDFYVRSLDRVLWWNAQGVQLREGTAAIYLNKLLSTFDGGYLDLQTPTAAGRAVLVYNYDGWVYPSDEARMLAETGNISLRLGRIGVPLAVLLESQINSNLRSRSHGQTHPSCLECAFNDLCGPDPIEEAAGGWSVATAETAHCIRSKWLFRYFLERLDHAECTGDARFLDIAYAWAHRTHPKKRLSNSAHQRHGYSFAQRSSDTKHQATLPKYKTSIPPLVAADSTSVLFSNTSTRPCDK